MKLQGLSILIIAYLARGDVSWIMSCANEGMNREWLADQPMEGSVAQALVTCMVNHVMTSPYTEEELQLLPSVDEWCLPDDFLSELRTCASLRFDIFAPIRYCIEVEGFPELSSDSQYSQGFHDMVPSRGQSSFYLSSKLANAMCSLLDGLHSKDGRACLLDVCRHASHAPSQVPTSQPSVSPSCTPSRAPSIGPSSLPSGTPSIVPSTNPSNPPTLKPSSIPSVQPTREGTEHPSAYPTRITQSPSALPSLLPSWYPTPSPSAWSPLGPGRFLQIKITLRVLLDGVETVDEPLSDPTIATLERALGDAVRSVQGFQHVEIGSATRAPAPDNAPILLVFRISAVRRCRFDSCEDPLAASSIAREFRTAFENAVQTGNLQRMIRRQASRYNITCLSGISPRPNSSNLMSSNSLFITNEEENTQSSGIQHSHVVHVILTATLCFVLS